MTNRSNTRLSTYLRGFWGDWFTRMSGPATVPLAVLAIYFPKAPLKILFGTLAVACGVFSSYWVWRRERLRYIEVKQAQLIVHDERNSRFYVEVGGEHRDRVLGTYLELRLSIENKGQRNSIVRRFDLEITELSVAFSDVRSQRRNYIQTLTAQHMTGTDFDPSASLVVPSENILTTMLPFYLTELNPGDRTALHCKLTLTDTEGVQANHVFTSAKAG